MSLHTDLPVLGREMPDLRKPALIRRELGGLISDVAAAFLSVPRTEPAGLPAGGHDRLGTSPVREYGGTAP